MGTDSCVCDYTSCSYFSLGAYVWQLAQRAGSAGWVVAKKCVSDLRESSPSAGYNALPSLPARGCCVSLALPLTLSLSEPEGACVLMLLADWLTLDLNILWSKSLLCMAIRFVF